MRTSAVEEAAKQWATPRGIEVSPVTPETIELERLAFTMGAKWAFEHLIAEAEKKAFYHYDDHLAVYLSDLKELSK